MVALDQGDAERARANLREGLTYCRELDNRWTTMLALEVCARLAAVRGQQVADAQQERARAAELFGAAEALRERLGAPRLAMYEDHYHRSMAMLRSQLDADTLAAAWAEGRTLTLEQAVAAALAALGDERAPAAAAAQDGGTSRGRPAAQLTAREVEVLRVVAEGGTDQEVAARLGLRPRTVTSYLASIYTKLDVRTRTAAVRVARERDVIA